MEYGLQYTLDLGMERLRRGTGLGGLGEVRARLVRLLRNL